MKRLLSTMTLLAFAIFVFTVSGATASPVIDPPGAPPVLVSANTRQLTDGWYSAAVQQTIINAAKKHPRVYYRSSLPISGHGPVLP
jgi:hypothetical protein